MVQTILVFRIIGWSSMIIAGEILVDRTVRVFCATPRVGGMMLSGTYSGVQNWDSSKSSGSTNANFGMGGLNAGGPIPAPVAVPHAMVYLSGSSVTELRSIVGGFW
jgi:hypothetical protein